MFICDRSPIYSYSLYEPKSHALMEYNGGGLEKAIVRDSELLSEVNDAFCKSHPLLAQKVVTRSARAAVSKIGADALVSKALSVRGEVFPMANVHIQEWTSLEGEVFPM